MKKLLKEAIRELKDVDKPLMIMSIILFSFGLLNIATASSSEAVVNNNYTLFHFFTRQLSILLFGIIPFIFILKISTKKYRPIAIIGFISVLALSIILLIDGSFHRGANNWLNIFGSNSIQPSEFAKPVIIVSLALIFDIYFKTLRSNDQEKFKVFWLIIFVGVSIPLIVFIQKDLGTALIQLAIFGLMFISSPLLRKDKVISIGAVTLIGIILFLILISNGSSILTEAQKARFDFLDPCSKYETGGYQTCNGFIAINDGGLFGLGLGKSKQKYSYIPEPHTDSVFAIVAEETGLIGTTILFAFYIGVLSRILKIASKAVNIRGKYIALGVAGYIFFHIIINLGGLFALMPLTGVPLPFLSYGGSFALSLVISLALVQRVSIETKNQHLKL